MNRFIAPVALSFALTACGGGEEAPAPAAPAAPAAAAPAPAPAGGYEEQDAVADAGNITGTISYSGDKTDEVLAITQDTEVCAHDHPERPAGALLLNEGKLQNAVVYLEGVKAGKKWDSSSVAIDNVDCAFAPRISLGRKGGDVVAKNSDPVTHNTNMTLTQGSKTIMNSSLKKDGEQSKKLKKSGLVEVRCDLHDWMKGALFVADSPYAAVTGEDGAFSLSEVPAGDYTVKVWHEVLGEKEASVTVTAGADATSEIVFE
ncbi:MAG: hypothetical protein VX519_03745 [Myxococcota bacterium]|nr:hypothetical protein [Myxococcota bacterium]